MAGEPQRPVPKTSDVAVAGGGPAGAVVATLLAKLGYDVALFEARHFPRPHIGESLTPTVQRLFEFLEIDALIDAAGFVRMPGHTVHWGGRPHTNYFTDEYDRPTEGFQVWRETFDQLLIDRARAAGVRVHHGIRVTAPLVAGEGVAGVRYVRGDGAVGRTDAAITIDATGRSAVLARARGFRRYDTPARSLSLWSYWRDAADLPGRDALNTLVESIPDGWIWSLRPHPELRNVTINVDLDEARRELAATGLEAFYLARVAQSTVTAPLLTGASRATPVRGCDTTWYHGERYAEPGCLAIGDAASLIDPLTSQGVRKALSSAINAAVVTNTVLTDPGMTELAWRFLADREESAYQRYRRQTVRAFLEEDRFGDRRYWQRRSRQTLGEPAPPPPPPRRGLLRQLALEARLQDLVPRWAADARIEEGAVVEGPVLVRRPVLVSARHPEGRTYPELEVDRLFPLIDGQAPITDVVDRYLLATGRGVDQRAAVMTLLERLVEDWLCDLELPGDPVPSSRS